MNLMGRSVRKCLASRLPTRIESRANEWIQARSHITTSNSLRECRSAVSISPR